VFDWPVSRLLSEAVKLGAELVDAELQALVAGLFTLELLLEVSDAAREISDRGSLTCGAACCELVAHQHGKQPVGRIIVRGHGRALLGGVRDIGA